ncbi:ATP-binding protein [Sulfidibacter corallicola]|uniref:ATP-binding protein n=1 Tax=Sulfidibacter corallicola TaxID=2818388 RepID=A0A8A4TPI2_SULCO|nr:ATP-binding protein [Sulfidibacter corallicola]QTD51114.1 ATP-binding protein [Sulfidibacter corallicola]
MYKHECPAELDSVREIMEIVEVQMRGLGLDEKRVLHMGLVAEEIATNIIIHAYRDKPAGAIEITIQRLGGTIVLVFRDGGAPFDSDLICEPDLEAPILDREVGGLGLYFMRKLVDRFQYRRESGRNVWTFEVQSG